MKHIPEETLEQYSLQRLSESEIERVENHLLVCTTCQDLLTDTEDFLYAVKAATQQLENEPVVESWWTRWTRPLFTIPRPVFAAAACAVFALMIYIPRQTQTAAEIQLQAMRGPESAAQAPAGKALMLRLSLAGVEASGPLEVQVADANGTIVSKVKADREGTNAVAKVESLQQGTYWARLYSGDELLREYGINVR